MEQKILMPRLGVNDDMVCLGQWLIENGSEIKKGQKIAVLETSKETSELLSDFDGFIQFSVKAGMDVKVGEVIAIVSKQADKTVKHSDIEDFSKKSDEQLADKPTTETKEVNETKWAREMKELRDARIFTKKAQNLLDAHPEIDVAKFPTDRIIKEKDVLGYIKESFHLRKTISNHVLIYGRGGLCKDIIDIIHQTNAYQIAGIVDFYYPQDDELYGVPVVGGVRELKELYEAGYHKIISGVAFWGEKYNKHYRKNPALRLEQIGFEFINVIDKSASIATTVRMGEGNLICANTYVGPDAKIGSDVILNVGCIVNHDCVISDHCHIASGAVLAGEVKIGENSLIGQGAIVHAGVKIGSNVTINNGCIVFKDVSDGVIVAK